MAQKPPAKPRPDARPVAKPAPVPAAAPPKLSDEARRFLRMDSHESFDLDSLNEINFPALWDEFSRDQAMVRRLQAKCEELLARLCQDLGDVTIVDDILRDKLMIWHQKSAEDAAWTSTMPSKWAGIIHESRAAGGKLRPSLITRVEWLRTRCASALPRKEKPSGGLFKKMFSSDQAAEKAPEPVCPPQHALMTQVAQAFLDDLATGRRKPGVGLPLVRVTEVAQRGQASAVNKVFAELFACEERGPFIILHPARYPDFDLAAVRPPPPNAPRAALVYDLVCVKAPEQTSVPDAAALIGAVASPQPLMFAMGSAPGAGMMPQGPPAVDTSAAVWERKDITKEEWKLVIEALRTQRGRLEPPPGDYRKRPAYFTLRELIVTDRQAARPFLSVKWRGRPTGPILLAQLLADKTLTPDVETDYEYLEAELGDIERGSTDYRPANGQWIVGGNVKIVRESGGGAVTYKAEPAT